MEDYILVNDINIRQKYYNKVNALSKISKSYFFVKKHYIYSIVNRNHAILHDATSIKYVCILRVSTLIIIH